MQIEKRKYYIIAVSLILLIVIASQCYKTPKIITAVTPDDNAINVNIGILKWDGEDGRTYDLYLGYDPNPPLFKENITGTEEKPLIFELNKTYYWKIIAKDGDEIIDSSKVFSFSTLPLELNPVVKYNCYIDKRDYKIYWTININGKEWMAQNLDYELKDYSWYYNDNEKNKLYGRLYSGEALIAKSNEICPDGWHIPTKDEWSEMVSNFGHYNKAGAALKDASKKYWKDNKLGTDNKSGMTILPSGSRNNKSVYANLGRYSFIWTSTPDFRNPGNYFKADLDFIRNAVNISSGTPIWCYSIRCVKD